MLEKNGFEHEDYSNYKRGGKVSIFTRQISRREYKAAASTENGVVVAVGRTRRNAISNIIKKLAMELDFVIDYEWLDNDQVVASTVKFPGIFGVSVEEAPAKRKLLKRIYHIRTIILVDGKPIDEDHKEGVSAKHRIVTSKCYTSAPMEVAVAV